MPFRAPPGVRFADFPIPAGYRLAAGIYGGKHYYCLVHKNTHNALRHAA